jgi:hypothetical protein
LSIEDNFSAITAGYAAWRPDYPEALFTFLASLTKEHDTAWDCATGNGQAAKHSGVYYKDVYATDISAAQLKLFL